MSTTRQAAANDMIAEAIARSEQHATSVADELLNVLRERGLPVLVAEAGVTVQIGSRGRRYTFGDCRSFSRRALGADEAIADYDAGRDVDYCWLNQDCVVIDGRPKPLVNRIEFGDLIAYKGYGTFRVEPDRNDNARLVPTGTVSTDEQQRAIMDLGDQHERMTITPFGRAVEHEAGYARRLRVAAQGPWRRYVVEPDGTIMDPDTMNRYGHKTIHRVFDVAR